MGRARSCASKGATDTSALRRLRQSGRTPICADGRAETARLRQIVMDEAVDVVMCDLFGVGGIENAHSWFQTAHAMRISSTLHSGPELGVGQAARLHVAAAHPDRRHAIDGHYHHYVDDVLVGGKIPYVDGAMMVAQAPGLGVELDDERLLCQLDLRGITQAVGSKGRMLTTDGRRHLAALEEGHNRSTYHNDRASVISAQTVEDLLDVLHDR